ncbi:MAG: class I SAM-dependent methyltransferase [Deltaproteobacteria bacterium]|nr:class I SAM-dependent methyltransferase [Deltaproteobacteria bacterium]
MKRNQKSQSLSPLKTSDLTIEQLSQEAEYEFPYHYVTQFKDGQFKHFFLDTWSINYASTIEFLLQRIDAGQGTRIVDIGCGDGRFSRELALAFQSSAVVGIDYSRRAIALALAMNTEIANLSFESVDITAKHPFGTFDVAVLMEVIEHIPIEDAVSFIRSVRALIKDGGVLYLTVPHENKPLEYKHHQHFSVEKIVECLTPSFEIAEVLPFERITWFRGLILNLLSNRLFILNSPRLLSMVYRWYKKNLFFCASEKDCQRIFVKAVAR